MGGLILWFSKKVINCANLEDSTDRPTLSVPGLTASTYQVIKEGIFAAILCSACKLNAHLKLDPDPHEFAIT